MAVLFCDSSALVKRYAAETGTAWIIGITSPSAGNDTYIALITGVEVTSSIARRKRAGSLSVTDAATATAAFRRDFAVLFRPIEITLALVLRAMTLAETYGLRGYDSMQLAAALEVNADTLSLGLPPITLISSDAELNAAAAVEGLAVEDPNAHP